MTLLFITSAGINTMITLISIIQSLVAILLSIVAAVLSICKWMCNPIVLFYAVLYYQTFLLQYLNILPICVTIYRHKYNDYSNFRNLKCFGNQAKVYGGVIYL